MRLGASDKRRIITVLFVLSGLTGLIYESVWIRLFTIAFGNTAQAFSTVLGVYLGGLALGASWAGRVRGTRLRNSLVLYGAAEVLVGAYALATPKLIALTQVLLASLYGPTAEAILAVSIARAVLCSLILLPATVFMGATLPFLADWLSTQYNADATTKVSRLYVVNLAGACLGALLTGFVLLPGLGYSSTLVLGCILNLAIGGLALWLGWKETPTEIAPSGKARVDRPESTLASANSIVTVAFFSGWACMLYEVAWGRIFGLLFGPTASTVTLILAMFLLGLTLGGMLGSRVKTKIEQWLCAVQFGAAILLFWASLCAGQAPQWVAAWVKSHNGDPLQLEWMKILLLTTALLPLTVLLGVSFPLMLRLGGAAGTPLARRVGGLYGINTLGCILGSLAAGWILIPSIGTERTLSSGAAVNLFLGVLLLWRMRPRVVERAVYVTAALGSVVLLWEPRWDMTAMTAGAYKYAPYYEGSGEQYLHQGDILFLREGTAGTVAVKRNHGSLILSIDGKIDASDSGADLLTEKLLAHLPLSLAKNARKVCLIGLASGVTAGSALTYPIESLDLVEISREVALASNLFARVNGSPLADARTHLIANDGRNHLALTNSRYDVIISEPSNPWIAGMNGLFTRDFFRIAKAKLAPGGLLAQWFHIYNMPQDDLKSLVRTFTDVFPNAILWQLNDGDVLLTGFASEQQEVLRNIPAYASKAARADLVAVGIADPDLLMNLYVMRVADLRSFSVGAEANTDDHPLLEFHGQRDLHAQTDLENAASLHGFSQLVPAPEAVRKVQDGMTAQQWIDLGTMFERGESFRSAFHSYRMASQRQPGSLDALAGMDRSARTPEERAPVLAALGLPVQAESLEDRTAAALVKAQSGDALGAARIFQENAKAHPDEPAAYFNYGLFCLERKDYGTAVEQFQRAIHLNDKYLAAYEAMAETYLQMRDFPNAAEWSRRILQLDPGHVTARQTLAALEGKLSVNHNP